MDGHCGKTSSIRRAPSHSHQSPTFRDPPHGPRTVSTVPKESQQGIDACRLSRAGFKLGEAVDQPKRAITPVPAHRRRGVLQQPSGARFGVSDAEPVFLGSVMTSGVITGFTANRFDTFTNGGAGGSRRIGSRLRPASRYPQSRT